MRELTQEEMKLVSGGCYRRRVYCKPVVTCQPPPSCPPTTLPNLTNS